MAGLHEAWDHGKLVNGEQLQRPGTSGGHAAVTIVHQGDLLAQSAATRCACEPTRPIAGVAFSELTRENAITSRSDRTCRIFGRGRNEPTLQLS